MRVHYTDTYLKNPAHKISVDLVGVGGTGSQVLTGLARINEGLMSMGHPGLFVRAFDNDIVTQANIGRQMFSTSDIGMNKAVVLVTRINRFFGYEWQGVPDTYGCKYSANITISCIDTAKGRVMLGLHLEGPDKPARYEHVHHIDRRIYWLDIGNLEKTGQVVLGTIHPITQPKSDHKTAPTLKTVTKLFPGLDKIQDDKLGPSCSLAEALNKQDLFINSTMAQFACNLIWKLFREGMIKHHGCYVNLDSCIVNPIKIPDATKRPQATGKDHKKSKKVFRQRNIKRIKQRHVPGKKTAAGTKARRKKQKA
jgi:PRTRC genetic system ThiF family protein